ncbi:helix-turn-helix domain-containing protein [Fusobacterium ulcerans]|uniref:helix-turn-helix domain-containing protein n=1 Tax=Fusobacterium ulcerans TaxID=861 RepID=UPI0026F30261|nr:helix-turn-helix domain-containing protein [Fusobacterium ulcerans]
MFIDNKKIVLLNHLNEDIEKVSEILGISERTIRYRIEDLNEFFIDEKIDYKIVIESRIIKGFGNLEEVIKELEDNFSKSERMEIIFLFLLISSNGCKADEICNLVDISRSTFKIDMRFVRQEFEKKKLKVISKANKGLIIVGHEIIIRKTKKNF